MAAASVPQATTAGSEDSGQKGEAPIYIHSSIPHLTPHPSLGSGQGVCPTCPSIATQS